MARLRSDAQFGTLSASVTDNGATLSSAQFADLPVVESPDYLAITLDPEETVGPAEIVWVTVHSAGASSVTVARNQEGTTARAHASGVKWAHAATATDFEALTLIGKTGASELTLSGNLILNGSPTGTNQAATKGYVDSVAAGQRFKDACRVATTGPITIATKLVAGQTVDDVTLVAGDRVLVKDQTTQSQNGIYVAGTSPARATDADTSAELDSAAVFVIYGTQNQSTSWVQTTNNPTVDTSAIVWAQTGGGRTNADEETLTKVGSTMSIKDSGVTIEKISGSTGATAAQYLNGVGGWTTPTAAGLDWTIVSGTTLAALQSARGTVAGGATGRYIYVPAGRYELTSTATTDATLVLNVPNQTWVFHPQAIITRATSADPAPILSIQSTDIRISGGIIDGGDSRATPRSGRTTETKVVGGQTVAFSGINAIVLTSAAARVTIENMTIRNAYNNAVQMNSTTSVRLQNLYVLNSGGTAINGTSNSADVEGMVVQGCLIDRTGFTGNSSYYGGGIKLMGHQSGTTYKNRGMRIIGNDIRQPYLNFADGDGQGGNEGIVYQEDEARNALVANNVVVGGSIGISYSRNIGGTIIGNTVYGFAKLGLEIAGADECTVTGNIVDGGMAESRVGSVTAYHNGIPVWDTPGATTVVGNTIRNLRAASLANGVLVQQDAGEIRHVTVADNVISVRQSATGIYANKVYGVTMTGNQIRCDESGTTTSTSGIKLGVDGKTTAGRFIVTNNQIRAAATGVNIVFSSDAAEPGVTSGTVRESIVMGNLFHSDVTTVYAKGGSVTAGDRLIWHANVGLAAATAVPTGWSAP